MSKFLLCIILAALVFSCAPEEKIMSLEEIKKEETAIINVLRDYNKAFEEKNFSGIVPTLAGEVIFFGTDSAEVIKTFADYKKQLLTQWDLFDRQKYGSMSDISIQMDKNATFASAIYGIPYDVTIAGETAHLFLRVARILKKEEGKWVIVSGIIGITNTDEAMKLDHLLRKKLNPEPVEEIK